MYIYFVKRDFDEYDVGRIYVTWFSVRCDTEIIMFHSR